MLIDEFLTDGLKNGKGFQYTNYDGKYVVIDSIKDLLMSSKELVVVKLNKGEISVKGENLSIKELGKSSICIEGKILSVESL